MRSNDFFNELRFWTDSPTTMAELDNRDAELDREDSLSERYAFQLGEDLGIFRLSSTADWPSAEMERGYVHGLGRAGKHADVYLRKLLTLRRNAFARGIPVSSSLTTEFLRLISVTTCPVSGEPLTQGTLQDSDWSLDRLENSLGYVPGNVCFLSSRVNTLKGADDFKPLAEDACRILVRDGEQGFTAEAGNGMTVLEALRLAALMCAPSAFAKGMIGRYAPLAMAPAVWATVDAAVAGMHVACARDRISGLSYDRRVALFKGLGKELWHSSNRLVEHIRRKLRAGTHPADIWLDGSTFHLLRQLSDAFLQHPPDVPGLSDDQAISQVIGGMQPLHHFHRGY